jgi:hypothetical protein
LFLIYRKIPLRKPIWFFLLNILLKNKNPNDMKKTLLLCSVLCSMVCTYSQSPGGISVGLRTWYKADAVTGFSNGQDMASWADQATADGTQNAVQNGRNLATSLFGNRQPQYRTPVARYNYNPFVDFTKQFSSFFAYKAHSNKPDYQYNYTAGATLYQVGDLTNNQGYFSGSGLGATTLPSGGYNYEYGYPWWGLNQQNYGVAGGYYYATVNDYGYNQINTPPYNYNYLRPERKTRNTIPWINSISYDKYGTYNGVAVTILDAKTAIQTRVNGDKWSWGYAYTPAGPSLFIGNELTNYNAGRWWKGGIPEVILYNRKLNTSQGNEADKVDTYLALKYGITLLHNYYLSDGTKIFDTGCNVQFKNQIAGLIKDNASALHQKQTHSIEPKSIVSMSVGDVVEFDNSANAGVITDKYSMIYATNATSGNAKDSRGIPGGYAAIPSPPGCLTATNATWSAKKWMVQEQTAKDIGSVNVYIESKDLQAVDWACQAYLVVGTDAVFANPVYYPLSLAALTASATDYVASVNFCEGASNASTVCGTLKTQFFAVVGKGIDIAPGGVTRNLAFWVRADMGTINDSTSSKKTEAVPGVISRVREWVNLAKGPNAVPGIAGDAPTLRAASRYDNFNTMVSFQNAYVSSGNTYPSLYENTDPNTATMRAKNVVSNYGNTGGFTGAGADSLSMFSAHRNLADFSNSGIGVGYAGLSPGLTHDIYNRNSVEYRDLTTNILASTPPNFTAPYPGTQPPPLGTAGYVPSSNFGRSYQSALFWYPRNPTTINYSTNNIVDMALRGNGANLPMTTQSRATTLTYYGPSVNPIYNRSDVCLAGGVSDYGGAGMQEAILYIGGFKAVDFEVERIETYLGIRNGITIRHNYYATDKTLLWDTTAIVDAAPNAPAAYTGYNKSITGIGRDKNEALHQRVSRNAEDTVVTIALNKIPDDENNESVDADFLNDKEYLLWGSNGGAQNARITTDLPSSLPGCLDSRINREYHVKLTGSNTGNYKTQVRWQLDNNLLDAVSATSVSLLIDDDGDGNFNTGTVRVIPSTSYDAPTNSAVFDNVQWSVVGDPDVSNAAMTIGWGQTSVSKVVLFNGTATGGGNCVCAGATAYVAPVICSDAAGWTYYKNTLSNNKILAVNWGSNVVTANITLDASTAAAARRKTNLNVSIGAVKYDSAATLGARMLNITLTSGSITAPVKLRFYYDSAEFKTDSSWIVGTSTVGNGGGILKPYLSDSSWTWFKFEGTIANVIANLSASGLPLGDGTTANTYTALVPDEKGIEDGVKYVQFNYITNFSTIGYMQTFAKNNDLTLLPLKLLSFEALLKGNTTNLFWNTANEENVSSFEVERSTDGGKTFKAVGQINAKGSGSVNEYYFYDDVTGLTGKVFYRLKVIEAAGSSTYSPIKFISIAAVGSTPPLSILPNPFHTQVSAVVFSAYNEAITIKVLSATGKEVYVDKQPSKKGSNVFVVRLPALPVGTYILEVIHEDGMVETKRILKN